MHTRYKIGFSLLLSVLSCTAFAQNRIEIDSIQPLLGIAMTQGKAYGFIPVKADSNWGKAFKSSSPILVDVERLHLLSEKGCARFTVKNTQDNVVDADLKAGKTMPAQTRTAAYAMNYCLNGGLPADPQFEWILDK